MPPPLRRPSPFLFLLLASPILKICAACQLALGIVSLIQVLNKAMPQGLPAWFAFGGVAIEMLVRAFLLLAAGDFCIAIIDMHRDAASARERLEVMGSASAAGIPPPPRSLPTS